MTGNDFVIININGIHEVRLDFCNCKTSKPHFIQLLRYGLYPATVDHPKTAATFTILEHFQMLNFESKASVFEFYNTLSHLTDNTGLFKLRVCELLQSCGLNHHALTILRINIALFLSWFNNTGTWKCSNAPCKDMTLGVFWQLRLVNAWCYAQHVLTLVWILIQTGNHNHQNNSMYIDFIFLLFLNPR